MNPLHIQQVDNEFHAACEELDRIGDEFGIDSDEFDRAEAAFLASSEDREKFIKKGGLEILNYKALIKAKKAIIAKYNHDIEMVERRLERISVYVGTALGDSEKIEEPEIRIFKTRSEKCRINDVDKIPSSFQRKKEVIDYPLQSIKDALKEGILVPGAEIIINYNLRVK